MKRRFLGIFICLLSVLLMSHNTNAASNSGVYGISSGYMILNGRQYNGTIRDNNSLRIGASWDSQTAYLYDGDLSRVCFSTNGGITKGAYISLSVRLSASLTGSFAGFSGDSNLGLVSQNVEFSSDSTVVNLTFFNNGGNNSSFCLSPSNGQYIAYNNNLFNSAVIFISPVSWYYNDPYTESLNSIYNKLDTVSGQMGNIWNKLDDVQGDIQSGNQAQQDHYDQEQESIDNIDNQTTDDIDGTEDANTTSLIGLFSSFVSALSSASATNCNIDGDMGNVDLGTLNLCRDNPPAFVQIIGSIFLIVLFVPLAYFLVKRIISEIRSFTNG